MCARHPSVLLSSLCHLGSISVRTAGAQFAPMLPATVAALTAALGACPCEGAPLISLADSLFDVFADQVRA